MHLLTELCLRQPCSKGSSSSSKGLSCLLLLLLDQAAQ
jgi:hypothetical protein